MATAGRFEVTKTMENGLSGERRGSLPLNAKLQKVLFADKEGSRRGSLPVSGHLETQRQLPKKFNQRDRDVLLPDKARKLLGLQQKSNKRFVKAIRRSWSETSPDCEKRYTSRNFFKTEKLSRWFSNLHISSEEGDTDIIESTSPRDTHIALPIIVIDSSTDSDSEECQKKKSAHLCSFEEGLLNPSVYTLDAAVARGDGKTLEAVLCSGNVRPNALNASGGTAMHEAAFQGKLECLRVFLRFGVDINIRDKEGWTPLHAAVCGGDAKCVAFLLRHGARTDIETDEGVKPVQIAIQSGDRKIVGIISKANADRGVRQNSKRQLKMAHRSKTPQQRAWENIYGSGKIEKIEGSNQERKNNKVTHDIRLRNRIQSVSPHLMYF